MEEESVGKVDLTKLKNELMQELVQAGVITDQGIRNMGNGLIIKKLDEIWKKLDQISLRVYGVEQDTMKLSGRPPRR